MRDVRILRPRLGAKSGDRESHHSIQVWAEGHEFPAGNYVFDNEVPGFATIRREGINSGIGVSLILYTIPREKDNPSVIFVLRDGQYFLFEFWDVQDRYVVTEEFEHRGAVSEQQRRVPLTIVEAHDQ
jgi:hypothetical protein